MFTLDILGIAALRDVRNIYYFQQAANQLDTMVAHLHALNNNNGLQELISNWNTENKSLLPQGVGSVTGGFPTYHITVFWGDQSHTHCQQTKQGQSGCITANVTA
jgi:hypothetical protein